MSAKYEGISNGYSAVFEQVLEHHISPEMICFLLTVGDDDFLSDSIRLLMFICLGVLKRDIMWEVLFIFPVAMLGLWLGMESSKIMNDAIARKILLVMLIFSSLGLVFNNL